MGGEISSSPSEAPVKISTKCVGVAKRLDPASCFDSSQAQLVALKEENRRLKLQLHAEENAKLNKLNSNYLLNQFTCSRNRSQSFSNIDSVDNADSADKKQPPAPPPRRDFGVMAGVLTRNVGVGHQTPHTKTVSTATQSEQHVDRWYIEKTKFLSLSHLPPVSKGTQTIFTKEKRDVCIQTKMIPTTKEICTQTNVNNKKILVDSAVNARIPVCNAHTQCAVKMITIGISDDTIENPHCMKCDVQRSTVGIDTSDFSKQFQLQPISLAALSISRSKSFHLGEEKLNHPRARTIGCQYENNYHAHKSSQSEIKTISKHTQHEILRTNKAIQYESMVQTKSTDTGGLGPTMQNKFTECMEPKVQTIDVSCNTTKENTCAKCTKEPEEVVKKDDPGTPSRIPRLQPPTTPVENRKLKRLDTYTKIPAEKPMGLSALELVLPKTITSEVSSFEKVKQKYKLPEVVKGSENGKPEEDKDVSEPTVSENALCQPPSPRKKCIPSREMQAAMKVLNDSLKKNHGRDTRPQMKNANALVENEWFKISSTVHADPMDVEDYLDCFEDISSSLLEHVVNMVDASGNTAMHYAVSHGNFDVVSILLDSKVCDINKQNKAGYTSVMLVSLADMCSQTHASVVRRLFLLADVNIRAKQHGQTALMLAVSHGRLDMVSMLLEAGADINIQDEDGSTALMCAAEHGHVDIVKHFLGQPDCDSSISDVDGSTALKIAMEAGHRHIGVLLYAHERNIHGNVPVRPKKSKSTSASPKTPSSPLMQRSATRALSTSK